MFSRGIFQFKKQKQRKHHLRNILKSNNVNSGDGIILLFSFQVGGVSPSWSLNTNKIFSTFVQPRRQFCCKKQIILKLETNSLYQETSYHWQIEGRTKRLELNKYEFDFRGKSRLAAVWRFRNIRIPMNW